MQNLFRTGNQPNCMPFLLNVTPSSRIEESDGGKFVYNDEEQVTYYCGGMGDTGVIGTRCLKTVRTAPKTHGPGSSYSNDKKNEIDDSKSKK